MPKTVHTSAPCKLNLHLRVLAKRGDGFHDIESVFQLISLADGLSVSIGGGSGDIRVVCPKMALPAENTVSRAITLFREETGIRDSVTVELDKRVPSGAGLGGGSSDAASTLRSLDALCGTQLPDEVMHRMARRIGSDVPFFLTGGAAIVTGRGELIEPLPSRNDLFGVLIWPGVHSSTAEAYGLVDSFQEAGGERGMIWPRIDELASRYRDLPETWPFRNSFTEPLEARYPEIREARLALKGAGAVFSEMSGSGSSVYGFFENRTLAENACVKLSARWQQCVNFLLLASCPMQ
jgi:4-diphosphocytidyl-2-C-methyl-D-erythritol kinase